MTEHDAKPLTDKERRDKRMCPCCLTLTHVVDTQVPNRYYCKACDCFYPGGGADGTRATITALKDEVERVTKERDMFQAIATEQALKMAGYRGEIERLTKRDADMTLLAERVAYASGIDHVQACADLRDYVKEDRDESI